MKARSSSCKVGISNRYLQLELSKAVNELNFVGDAVLLLHQGVQQLQGPVH